ncbi:PspC domain-containing protein [Lactobacillus sp. Sy-1]|uniref:PspC domain-containing protein n=1 Tax=Lactobacillus sp. Sy-1 TaxID=2109645 RepID=UPI001C572D69|nr:PspC domain-containing protein [Lactobacillus sp. Sy-1]MBW1605096.1 PspC domain-containing protein [Lactobacillus sp. Sy-1]
MNKKLYRSNNRIFAGVLGGIADYFDWDKTWTRLIYSALTIFSFGMPGLVLYIIAALIIPNQPERRDIDAEEIDSNK